MEEYMGMIKLFAGSFIPNGWAECNGQIIEIHRAENLYSILYNIYGGDGINTFALPDLRGRVPVGLGAQPGGETYIQGVGGGKENVALTNKNLPEHNHAARINMSDALGDAAKPDAESVIGIPNYPDGRGQASSNLYNKTAPNVTNTKMISVDSAGQTKPDAIDLRQPYIGMRYIICVQGPYPPRS